MGTTAKDAHSLWQNGAFLAHSAFEIPSLNKNISIDDCVIGAGIAGLSVAYNLLRAGRSVVILDRERIGFGETGLSSAHLSYALDERLFNLIKTHGLEHASQAAQSHKWAIDEIENIINLEQIDCDFKRVDGYLFLDPQTKWSHLSYELEAAAACGLSDVRLWPQIPSSFFDSGPCLRFPRQAQMNPYQYLLGLAKAVLKKGGQIFEHAEVSDLRGGSGAFVKTNSGFTVSCQNIIVATNSPIHQRLGLHTKTSAYRTYVVCFLLDSAETKSIQNGLEAVLLWDTAHPYHYIRFAKDPVSQNNYLMVGGEDHRTGQDDHSEKHFQKIIEWTKERLGIELPIAQKWSGQIIETLDGLAYIGKTPNTPNQVSEHLLVVTGDSGHGLTHSTVAGPLIRDLILKKENPLIEVYSPQRLPLRGLKNLVQDNAASTLPYSDYLLKGDVDSSQEIEKGEGAIVREGFHKWAVYRDEAGHLHQFSPVCPHLGGLVRWNSAEKSWDCPCHGSRFSCSGEVINGPTLEKLSPRHETPQPGQVEVASSADKPAAKPLQIGLNGLCPLF